MKKAANTQRFSFSAQAKLQVIDYALQTSQSEASVKFGVHKSMVSRWVKDFDKIKNAPANSKRISTCDHRVKKMRSDATLAHDDQELVPCTDSFQGYRRRRSSIHSNVSSSNSSITSSATHVDDGDSESEYVPYSKRKLPSFAQQEMNSGSSFSTLPLPEPSSALDLPPLLDQDDHLSITRVQSAAASDYSPNRDQAALSLACMQTTDTIQKFTGLDLLADVSSDYYSPLVTGTNANRTARYKYVKGVFGAVKSH